MATFTITHRSESYRFNYGGTGEYMYNYLWRELQGITKETLIRYWEAGEVIEAGDPGYNPMPETSTSLIETVGRGRFHIIDNDHFEEYNVEINLDYDYYGAYDGNSAVRYKLTLWPERWH